MASLEREQKLEAKVDKAAEAAALRNRAQI